MSTGFRRLKWDRILEEKMLNRLPMKGMKVTMPASVMDMPYMDRKPV